MILRQTADRVPQAEIVPVLRTARERLEVVGIGHARALAAMLVGAVDRDLDEPALERPFLAQPPEGLPRA